MLPPIPPHAAAGRRSRLSRFGPHRVDVAVVARLVTPGVGGISAGRAWAVGAAFSAAFSSELTKCAAIVGVDRIP